MRTLASVSETKGGEGEWESGTAKQHTTPTAPTSVSLSQTSELIILTPLRARIMTESPKSEYKEVPTKDADEIKKDEELVGLKPKMSLFNGITVIVGSIIGSGIFISPTGVLRNTGSVGMSLVVWIASGIFSMVGAYCYAELGCMIQKTGADYAYIMVTFGPFLAFMRLWVECLIVRPCSQTIVALTFSVYIMKPFFPTCDPPDDAERLLAAVCICKCVCLSSRMRDDYDFLWMIKLVSFFFFHSPSCL